MKPTYRNKMSNITALERMQRDAVLMARMKAEGNKKDLMLVPCGGEASSPDGKLLRSARIAHAQREQQAHTTDGDYLHLVGVHGVTL